MNVKMAFQDVSTLAVILLGAITAHVILDII